MLSGRSPGAGSARKVRLTFGPRPWQPPAQPSRTRTSASRFRRATSACSSPRMAGASSRLRGPAGLHGERDRSGLLRAHGDDEPSPGPGRGAAHRRLAAGWARIGRWPEAGQRLGHAGGGDQGLGCGCHPARAKATALGRSRRPGPEPRIAHDAAGPAHHHGRRQPQATGEIDGAGRETLLTFADDARSDGVAASGRGPAPLEREPRPRRQVSSRAWPAPTSNAATSSSATATSGSTPSTHPPAWSSTRRSPWRDSRGKIERGAA